MYLKAIQINNEPILINPKHIVSIDNNNNRHCELTLSNGSVITLKNDFETIERRLFILGIEVKILSEV